MIPYVLSLTKSQLLVGKDDNEGGFEMIPTIKCQFLYRITILLFLFCGLFLIAEPIKADNKSPSNRKLKFGTSYDNIGTFDGWTFWVGYDASFSENYDPKSESYAWVVHFAPEGMYVSLQKGKATYSAVDVNAGFGFLYGLLYSPDGNLVTRSYFSDISGITFSVSVFSLPAAPVGALSQLSVGISSGTTFFRSGSSKKLQRAIQYSTGFSTSFNLMPVSFPFGVSLGCSSEVTAGFYPIAEWDIWDNEGNPTDAIISGLKQIASSSGETFIDINLIQFSDPVYRFMERFPLSSKVDAFIESKTHDTEIDNLIGEVEEWLQTGDTKNLPEKLKPNIPPKKIYKIMKPIQSATTAAFEAGYKHGYDAKNRSDAIYANCVKTVKCKPGKYCKLVVTSKEIAELVPGSKPADFEGIGVIFDIVPESYLMSQTTEKTVYLKNGKAVYKFVLNMDNPIFLGVRIASCKATGNKRVELCRRKVVF